MKNLAILAAAVAFCLSAPGFGALSPPAAS